MKILLSCILAISLLSATSVETKIKQSKKQLSAKKVEYKKMDKQLSSMAKKIISAKKKQKVLVKKITKLEDNIKNNETEYQRLEKEDELLVNDISAVSNIIEEKQQKFVELASKKFSMALALEELKQPTSESVMMQEVYQVYAKKNSEEIEFLKKDISTLEEKKSLLSQKELTVKSSLDNYEKQRLEFNTKKIEQDKLVKNLARDKAIYRKRFKRIKSSRNKLEQKLANLKIVKYNQDEESKRAKVEEEAFLADESANTQDSMPIAISSPVNIKKKEKAKVVKIATPKIAKYSGGKTISPLKGARLIKKFGSYVDPIYKFKIFNKSVTLKAPHSGSKVKCVMPGKIVFAENSGGMLGKVVIIEHENQMHTIYAKLSRLAPGIHVGKKLSTGTVIGKVDKSLMFEVTKNNKHMNPMKLIRL